MQFSKEGDPITLGAEPLLAPGVRGTAFDTPAGIYIPLITADDEGSGAVGAFLDALPTDRRVVFPNVISARLEGMLVRRGFTPGVEREPHFGELVELLQRCPSMPKGSTEQ